MKLYIISYILYLVVNGKCGHDGDQFYLFSIDRQIKAIKLIYEYEY